MRAKIIGISHRFVLYIIGLKGKDPLNDSH